MLSLSSLTGLSGRVVNMNVNASVVGRYVRAGGFLRRPVSAPGPARWVLRVRDSTSQAVTIVMGNVTVRNAVEYPADSVKETDTEVMLPAGYVPTVVTMRSRRTEPAAEFDVAFLDPDTLREVKVDAALWYGVL
ncbi:hypothetical protein GPECTOR_2g1263 [Gonium pectorale]|uniref:Uncharacterized protein n=1 Tax=Gonium pectorale TaxID=33097 RepID=A0A150H130_GONPE|nr:hypothetical protein GPECTOR_2g1263 [Gonium pectorale]|eukprot:KXZ55713.1 hypothetical protein GPECTOR_2g1263 [Gonium pectorale]